MEEFAEIEPGSFKIEFTPREDGACVVSMEPSAAGGFPLIPGRCVRVVHAVVDGRGRVIEFPSVYNSPYLYTDTTYVVSDREGMFGRMCPACRCYFRTNCLSNPLVCPYCACRTDNGAFTTENQSRFMYMCCRAAHEASQRKVKTTFDLGEAAKLLPNNRPAWVCSEENQQTRFSCDHCKVVVDILGDYGNCPSCARRNYTSVSEAKMELLERRFAEADSRIKERHQREDQWKELLVSCASRFESLANDVRKQLLRISGTQKRKSDLASLSFQRIIKANECLAAWYGIEILNGISQDDREFLNRMFNRRHLVAHKGGIVDEEYLRNTDDGSVRLNQAIHVHSNEIRHLIALVRKAGQNLIAGYESIG